MRISNSRLTTKRKSEARTCRSCDRFTLFFLVIQNVIFVFGWIHGLFIVLCRFIFTTKSSEYHQHHVDYDWLGKKCILHEIKSNIQCNPIQSWNKPLSPNYLFNFDNILGNVKVICWELKRIQDDDEEEGENEKGKEPKVIHVQFDLIGRIRPNYA